MPIVVADYGITMPPVESVSVRRRVLHDAIKNQLDEILGTGHGWTIDLQEGFLEHGPDLAAAHPQRR